MHDLSLLIEVILELQDMNKILIKAVSRTKLLLVNAISRKAHSILLLDLIALIIRDEK